MSNMVRIQGSSSLTRSGESKTYSLHMIGSLRSGNVQLLTSGELYVRLAAQIIQKNQAQMMGQYTVQFETSSDDQSGYSAAIVLAESHITIHTWPEHNFVELDVYLCNVLRDNRNKCRAIFSDMVQLFQGFDVERIEVRRTSVRRLPVMSVCSETDFKG